ncbi:MULTISPECIES: VOC family protein [unclassified Mesobacillus]|uniref:VOC family protein n=1 Tax=unclassified Mesobacillus TaxID=2675270 RepID=UPI002040EBA7|nr:MULTISPECIES: VOC family protein [unclassified Mesobacillus]MCM3123164.1 VOC family protein [Mesobacillus sp. MER 33]MCM3233353.1 VOC family protein [Mesobacillus sp. MER 48]
MEKATPFLMFEGNAEEAMKYYTSLIEDSKITSISRYGPDGPGQEGSVILATFTLKGQEFMCIDSNIHHEFTFTPSFSIYLTCSSEDEIDHLFEKLSEAGSVLMPLGDYSFSKKFAWTVDRFGVSWQLNLPN